MPTELVLTALGQALTLRQPASGLIIHANRGSQYTSQACRQRIEQAGAVASRDTDSKNSFVSPQIKDAL